MERYSRQTAFAGVGTAGQRILLESRVAIVGMGALGGAAAGNLCRAGVGHIRFADMDNVEEGNLHRQPLYDEDDAGRCLPKAEAAFRRLSAINSGVRLEPVKDRIDAGNIEAFIGNADVVLDGTDNIETRLVINEACHKLNIPWIYCGVLGSRGMTLNILPDGKSPCLRCLMPDIPADYPTTVTDGVLNMITGVMAAIQSAEAVKILLHDVNVRRNLLIFDVWQNVAEFVEINKNPACPVCSCRN